VYRENTLEFVKNGKDVSIKLAQYTKTKHAFKKQVRFCGLVGIISTNRNTLVPNKQSLWVMFSTF
jgi:hypothetical protein